MTGGISHRGNIYIRWTVDEMACQSPLNKSNGYFHLDGIIGVEGEDNPLSTGHTGTISRVKKDDDLQELKTKSGALDSNQFRDSLVIRLPDHIRDVLQGIGEELSKDQMSIRGCRGG